MTPVGSIGQRGFYPFGRHTKHLAGTKFVTDVEVKQAVTSWLQTFDTDFFNAGIQAFVP
jgi:hypothetical protein